ncbi:hypothetical protein [Brevundimonas sp.]|uniref:hypothetical protein n=1 Tax=Brevundimonas sp. TaxID=1871086 RepID=UPI003F704CA0
MMAAPARRKVGWRENSRFWLSEHGGALGIPLTILALATLLALMWLILAPRYPARDVTGRITGLGFAELEGQGSVSTASIRVAGGFTRVELPTRIGDSIELRQLGVRWGYMYRVKNTRWPCQR